jgi:hypothetical protein
MEREERAEGSAVAAVSCFYRVFEAQVALDALTAWSEQGREPDALPATITVGNVTARRNFVSRPVEVDESWRGGGKRMRSELDLRVVVFSVYVEGVHVLALLMQIVVSSPRVESVRGNTHGLLDVILATESAQDDFESLGSLFWSPTFSLRGVGRTT